MAKTSAERERRRRDRRRRGRACAIVEYDYFALTELLIASGDLEERFIDDRAAVGRAMSAWLDRYIEIGVTRVSSPAPRSGKPSQCIPEFSRKQTSPRRQRGS